MINAVTETTKITPQQARKRAEIAATIAEEARRHALALLSGEMTSWRRTTPATPVGKFTVTVEFQP